MARRPFLPFSLAAATLILAACPPDRGPPASDDDSAATPEDPTPTGTLPIGAECEGDATCASGLCWDMSDYDPFCGGTFCTAACAGPGDDAPCRTAAAEAGAPNPDSAWCQEDRRCDLSAAGIGAIFCQ